MNSLVQPWYLRGWVWWVRRNPLYLLSAACMAIGARLYLVDPTSYAGDIGVILLTLGALQVYEWAVTSTLLLLHRVRRAPEDRGSLLLVAALFWTGPLAATIEMTAVDGRLGFLCAAGVVLFALLELFLVPGRLAVSLTLAGRLTAVACLLLVFLAPLGLRVEGAAGTNELLLYGCWLVLALLALGGVWCVHAYLRAQAGPAAPDHAALYRELAFLAIVAGATATHLVAMNYAFVGHARLFYAGPLLLALCIVCCDAARRLGRGVQFVCGVTTLLPIAVILASIDRFDPTVVEQGLPDWLRQPINVTLCLAAATWWFGSWRLRSARLFHLGNLALAVAIYRLWPTAVHIPSVAPSGTTPHNALTYALFAVTAYLLLIACLRRARAEAVLGLTVLQIAVATATIGRTPAAGLILGLTLGWSLLIVLHLGVRRPLLVHVAWIIAFMLGLTWFYDFDARYCWAARANTAALVAVLLIVGQFWRATRYRRVALIVVGAHATFVAARAIAASERSLPSLVVIAAFALLAAGLLVSWNKQRLLAVVPVKTEHAPPDEPA